MAFDIGDAVDDLFGTGSKPGVLGTGQEHFDPYQINQASATSPNGAALQQQAGQNIAAVNGRTAPTMQAGMLAPTSMVQGVQVGPTAQANAAQLGSATTMGAASIGDDQRARMQQDQLNNQLMQQANGQGPSLASNQLAEAQDRNAKQAMGLAASMQGQGNAALAQRQATNSVATNNQAAAQQAADARITEQNNARTALANNLGTTRSQTIGLNTSQAGLAQGANEANMGAQNQFAMQNASNVQQANLANAGALNTATGQQAELNYNTNAANAGALNQTNLTNAQLQQQANQANLQSGLQTQQQQDAMNQYYFGTQVGIDQSDRGANMQMQGMLANQNLGTEGLQSGAYNSAAQRQSALLGGAMQGGAGLLSLSDENEKTNISPLSDNDMNDIYGHNPLTTSDLDQIYGPGSGAPMAPQAPQAPAPPKGGKPSGGGSPAGLLAGGMHTLTKPGGTASSLFQGSLLGQVLNPGPSVVAEPMASPGGDYKMNGSGGLNVQATGDAINQSTVLNPTQHPGAMPMGGGGFNLGPLHISDQKEKDNVAVIDDARDDLRKITPYEYEYRDPSMPGAAPGKHVSPMAQDLEKTKLFKGAVSTDENGTKRVDYARAFGGMLAGMADLTKRVDQLQRKGR